MHGREATVCRGLCSVGKPREDWEQDGGAAFDTPGFSVAQVLFRQQNFLWNHSSSHGYEWLMEWNRKRVMLRSTSSDSRSVKSTWIVRDGSDRSIHSFQVHQGQPKGNEKSLRINWSMFYRKSIFPKSGEGERGRPLAYRGHVKRRVELHRVQQTKKSIWVGKKLLEVTRVKLESECCFSLQN